MRNHNPVSRFLSSKPSRKRAIEAMCAHCMGCTQDHFEPTTKADIRNCSAPHCPLYFYRPYQPANSTPKSKID